MAINRPPQRVGPGGTVLLGAAVSPETMGRALRDAQDSKLCDGIAWVELQPGSDLIEAARDLSRRLEAPVFVIVAELSLGGRGEIVCALRGRVGPTRGEEEWVDRAREAAEHIYDTLSEDGDYGFDEEDLAADLAWAMTTSEESSRVPLAPDDAQDLWAERLLAKLVAAGSIELIDRRNSQIALLGRIAGLLQFDRPGHSVYRELMESEAVDELYCDEDELDRILQEAQPKLAP